MGDINSIDTWSIIDTYFRDSHYYKTQHLLDSLVGAFFDGSYNF